ncbi:hypothetical protein KI387_033644 [Taxus chinensis]|uniref:RING-type E3 ubiquitin transferase n=1 Tax=Taxus chinensis TaxID=29808 RepID=A0AA38F5Z0_TAXCH|nr:hypothetical protein KI387_033644 [Taxus chinensis]
MDVTDEVRKQVELLHKQSRRAGLFIDPAEELLRNDVLSSNIPPCKLLHTNLIPSHALCSLICQWCEKKGAPFEKPEKCARNGALESIATTKATLEATKMTAVFLVENLSTGTTEVKKQVADELRLLAKCGMEKWACIAEAGVIPLLFSLLSSDDPKLQDIAVTALLNLSIYVNNKIQIVEVGCLDAIIRVLKDGRSMESCDNATTTLFRLLVIDDYKRMIGEKDDAISTMVDYAAEGKRAGQT